MVPDANRLRHIMLPKHFDAAGGTRLQRLGESTRHNDIIAVIDVVKRAGITFERSIVANALGVKFNGECFDLVHAALANSP
ncbi:hypothetical protein [Caudoviricetes sp.]|nr:hypothetical protein [Caudoviricetes sp.]UOF81543.1 hypothetical protein [Caudoviricetes sp.]